MKLLDEVEPAVLTEVDIDKGDVGQKVQVALQTIGAVGGEADHGESCALEHAVRGTAEALAVVNDQAAHSRIPGNIPSACLTTDRIRITDSWNPARPAHVFPRVMSTT